MALYQTLYFMSLVGGMAGLFSWALLGLVGTLPYHSSPNFKDIIAAGILGGFIGGLTVGFSDHWAGNRVLARWVASGSVIGILGGLAAGLATIPLSEKLLLHSPLLERVLQWMLVGSFIGLGLGLRWIRVNRARAAHAFTGGLVGGGLGALLFTIPSATIPELFQALAYGLTGVGIACGITLAPILLREGSLVFVSSGDARAQRKFGRTRKEWELQTGDKYIIGSQSQDLSRSVYRPEVEIYIPDASIAPRHAELVGRDGRFYITRYPDATIARYVLKVRGRTVTTRQELHDSDDILIGRTALEFVARTRTQSGQRTE